MKKMKYLIPVLGFAAVAPTCCLVSCGDKSIKGEKIELSLTYEDDSGDPAYGWFTFESQPITLKKDSTYTIVADLNKLQHFNDAWFFALTLSDFPPIDDYLNVQEIKVNTTQINKMTNPDDIFSHAVWSVSGNILAIQPKFNEKFKTEGTIYITFQAKVNTQQPISFCLANET